MMTFLRRALPGVLAALLAFTPTARAEGTRIRIGLTPLAEFLAAYVAADQGMFARRGLDVSFVPIPLNPTIPAALAAGSLEIGALNTAVFLLAIDGGLDEVVVSAASRTAKDAAPFALVVGNDVAFDGPQSLAGKRVLVPGLKSSVDVLFRRWLLAHDMDFSRISYVELPSPQLGNALRNHSADAAIVVEPFLTRVVQAGDGRIAERFAAELPSDILGTIFIAERSWATANPTAVASFRAALVEAVTMLHAHPDIARAALKAHLGLSDAVLAVLPQPVMQTEITPGNLRFWIDTMTTEGLLANEPDPAHLIWP